MLTDTFQYMFKLIDIIRTGVVWLFWKYWRSTLWMYTPDDDSKMDGKMMGKKTEEKGL